MNNESRRLLIELSYSATGELQDIDWKWIDRDSIPPEKLSKLHLQAEGLRQERLSNAKTERRKIGRNECCPWREWQEVQEVLLGPLTDSNQLDLDA